MTRNRTLAALLLLSAGNLALMIPGGLVETRSFPGYSVVVLAAFNVFLTLLGLGSLMMAYRLLRAAHVGMLPALAGAAYVLVYALDLLHLFPVAAAPMSVTLASMEGIGTGLGLATMAIGARGMSLRNGRTTPPPRIPAWLLLAMAGMALLIVTFATLSAR